MDFEHIKKSINALDILSVKKSIEKGLAYISNVQNSDGSFYGNCYRLNNINNIYIDKEAKVGFTNYIIWNLIQHEDNYDQIKIIDYQARRFLNSNYKIIDNMKYWSWAYDLQPDFDDTIIASYILELDKTDMISPKRFINNYGLINTWLNDTKENVRVDTIIQLNSLNYYKSDFRKFSFLLDYSINKFFSSDIISEYYLYPKSAFLYHLSRVDFQLNSNLFDLKLFHDHIVNIMKECNTYDKHNNSIIERIYIIFFILKFCKDVISEFDDFIVKSLNIILDKQYSDGSWEIVGLYKGPLNVGLEYQYGFGSSALTTAYVLNLLITILKLYND